MKYVKTTLTTAAIFTATAIFAASVFVDTTPGPLEDAPNCSNGLKLLSFSNLPGRSSGAFDSNAFYGCFANPAKFQIKIYSISLVDAANNETVIYKNANPEYVDIINNQFNPVRDLTSLPLGTYKQVKLTIDTDYKLTVDENIASDTSGNVSRVISYPAGNSYASVSNTGITGDGSATLRNIFRRDASGTAEPVTLRHIAFVTGGTNMTLSNVGWQYYYSGGGFGGGTVGKDSRTGCYQIPGVKTFCTDSEIATLTRKDGNEYPLEATWDTTGSSQTIRRINHALNLDGNGGLLDYWYGYFDNYSPWVTPSEQVKRSTITMDLQNNFVYDGTSGVIFDWRWITSKLLFLGIHAPSFNNGTRATIDIIGLGPFSMDLSISSVPNSTSGKLEIEANPSVVATSTSARK